MKSGRYQTSRLSRHWSPGNHEGFCLAPTCSETPESLDHLLIHCPFYSETREKLARLWTRSSSPRVCQKNKKFKNQKCMPFPWFYGSSRVENSKEVLHFGENLPRSLEVNFMGNGSADAFRNDRDYCKVRPPRSLKTIPICRKFNSDLCRLQNRF